MAVTIKIDETSKAGKALLELAQLLSTSSHGIEIDKDTYDPEFVQKVLNTENEDSISIKTKHLWESI